MTLANLITPTYLQMLRALSAWLDKAEVQLGVGHAEGLLAARLAPDMFPLSTQVRFACVQAWEGIARLQGQPFPDTIQTLLDEGRNAVEHPGSLNDARERIRQAMAHVQAVAPDSFTRDPETPLSHTLPNGMVFDLTAGQYVRDWAIPQFYFHLMAAYAILRAQGIDLGKGDYVAHMFAHLRPDTAPQA